MTTKQKKHLRIAGAIFVFLLIILGGAEFILNQKPAPEIVYSSEVDAMVYDASPKEAPKEEKIEKGKIPFGVHKYTIRKDTTPTRQNNAMSSINGIPVSKGGDFDITINGIDIHIKSISVLCPNELCSNHIWGELNFQFLDDYAGPCVCKKCKTPVYYSKDTIKTIYYNCPFCGIDEGSTCEWNNFCSNCGNDMRPLNRLY